MEQNTCYQTMSHLVSEVEALPQTDFLQRFEDGHNLKEFKIGQMSPAHALELYQDIFSKFMKNDGPKSELSWGQNELRLFMWILASYLQVNKMNIQQLGQRDWDYFCSIFPNKQHILFEYQAISLFKEPTPAKKWTQEEDDIFAALVRNKDNKYKWSELAKQLYISSDREYFRTPKQCRERWLNHLDPNKSKDEWELKEDFILINHVYHKGKKWAEISKLLKNRRNQHSIKNRFKSLITKEQKLHQDVKEESALIEFIYKKYDNHFSKMRLLNTISSHNGIVGEVKNQDHIPTTANITPKELISRQVFQVLKQGIKAEHQESVSQVSIQQNVRNKPSYHALMDVAVKQEREKQIRADMFLSEDPFDFLKRFFKSKDADSAQW